MTGVVTQRRTFHVRPDLKPLTVVPLLQALVDGADVSQLADVSGLRTSKSQDEAKAELRKLGLLDGTTVTDRGLALLKLAQRRNHLVSEAIHALYIKLSIETSDNPHARTGWAYAQVCSSIWLSGSGVLDSRGIIGRVTSAAGERFGLSPDQVTFGPKSVSGVTNWLGHLEPPIYTNSSSPPTISLRHVCPPEAMWWAVDMLHYEGGIRIPAGVRLPLTGDRVDTLCSYLLLHGESLGRALEQAKRRSDYGNNGIFDTGTAGGQGRWVLLSRQMQPPDTEA